MTREQIFKKLHVMKIVLTFIVYKKSTYILNMPQNLVVEKSEHVNFIFFFCHRDLTDATVVYLATKSNSNLQKED